MKQYGVTFSSYRFRMPVADVDACVKDEHYR